MRVREEESSAFQKNKNRMEHRDVEQGLPSLLLSPARMRLCRRKERS